MRKQGSCLEKQTMQGTMLGARRRGKPRTAWMDSINTWTRLSVEESIRMTDRYKWRKYVHGVANPRSDRGRLKTEQYFAGRFLSLRVDAGRDETVHDARGDCCRLTTDVRCRPHLSSRGMTPALPQHLIGIPCCSGSVAWHVVALAGGSLTRQLYSYRLVATLRIIRWLQASIVRDT